jgi:hypothetical protein
VEPSFKAPDRAEVEREEVEEERAVSFGGKRNHLATGLRQRLVEDPVEISSLSAQAGSVVDNFAVDFSGSEIDETHVLKFPSPNPQRC